jgi:hypothetical protein
VAKAVVALSNVRAMAARITKTRFIEFHPLPLRIAGTTTPSPVASP